MHLQYVRLVVFSRVLARSHGRPRSGDFAESRQVFLLSAVFEVSAACFRQTNFRGGGIVYLTDDWPHVFRIPPREQTTESAQLSTHDRLLAPQPTPFQIRAVESKPASLSKADGYLCLLPSVAGALEATPSQAHKCSFFK